MKGFKEYRNLKVYEMSGYQYKAVPTIRLQGAWLRDLGFEEGAPITVKCEGGRHTIARADEIPAEYREIGAEPVMCVAEAAGVYGKEGAYV